MCQPGWFHRQIAVDAKALLFVSRRFAWLVSRSELALLRLHKEGLRGETPLQP